MFDMRNTSRCTQELTSDKRVPIVCAQYLSRAGGFRSTGLMAGSLAGVSFWGRREDGAPAVETRLHALEGSCSWISLDTQKQQCLVSFRPSAKTHTPVRHALVSITRDGEGGAVDCQVHRNVFGEATMTKLTRSLVIASADPGGHSRIVAGEESRSLVSATSCPFRAAGSWHPLPPSP